MSTILFNLGFNSFLINDFNLYSFNFIMNFNFKIDSRNFFNEILNYNAYIINSKINLIYFYKKLFRFLWLLIMICQVIENYIFTE